MATIKDVAKLAGVGVGTASRVIAGKGPVSQDAIKRVTQAIGAEFRAGKGFFALIVRLEAEVHHHVALLGVQREEDRMQDRGVERSGDHRDEYANHP